MTSSSRKANSRTRKKVSKKRTRARHKRASPTTLAILDGLLLRKMRVTINGREEELTALGAIIHQLAHKEAVGDARASRVLLKYEKLAGMEKRSSQNIVFENDAYTRRLAAKLPGAGDG